MTGRGQHCADRHLIYRVTDTLSSERNERRDQQSGEPPRRRRTFGTFFSDQVAIEIEFAALRRAIAYSSKCLTQETGGFLIGRANQQDRWVVEIRKFLPASGTRSAAASLTFTHDSWSAVHRYLDKRATGEKIVGWHHTHPRMGPFLSEHDLFIQRSFFREPWHVALVMDPVQQQLAFFQSSANRVLDCGFAIILDTYDRPGQSR